jgi:hypothetical protein
MAGNKAKGICGSLLVLWMRVGVLVQRVVG